MYSLVLLMALTGSAEAPAFGHHSSCCGGYSCCGGSYGCCGGYSCCGGYGCSGSWSYGCCGGYSCCGGDYGCCGGWSSCCGGHHHGHRHHHSCCGGWSYGCCGGYSCCGGYGCSGSWSYGCCGGYSYGGYYSCCGGYGCDGGYMVPSGPAGVPAPEASPAPPAGGQPAPMPKPPVSKPGEEVSAPAPATIQVSLPADAKLMIDDAATTSTSASRVFVSPELAPGKDFQYTLKAEITRDGQTLTAIERVTVRAGQETRISLPLSRFATASVAAK